MPSPMWPSSTRRSPSSPAAELDIGEAEVAGRGHSAAGARPRAVSPWKWSAMLPSHSTSHACSGTAAGPRASGRARTSRRPATTNSARWAANSTASRVAMRAAHRGIRPDPGRAGTRAGARRSSRHIVDETHGGPEAFQRRRRFFLLQGGRERSARVFESLPAEGFVTGPDVLAGRLLEPEMGCGRRHGRVRGSRNYSRPSVSSRTGDQNGLIAGELRPSAPASRTARLGPRAEKPFRDELLSIERLEERAKALAARFTARPQARAAARADGLPAPRRQRPRPARGLPRPGRRRPPGGVRHPGHGVDPRQLPPGGVGDPRRPPEPARAATTASCPSSPCASRRAPRASTPWPWSSSATATAAWTGAKLVRFMNSYQTVAPLTIGELWAWPSMLKLALIENLRRLADKILESRAARRAADAYVARIDSAGQGALPPLPRGAAHRLRGPAPAAHPRVRAAPGRGAHGGGRAPGRPAHDRRRTRSAASTRARPRPRSRWPTSSPACACARRSTGASTSSR